MAVDPRHQQLVAPFAAAAHARAVEEKMNQKVTYRALGPLLNKLLAPFAGNVAAQQQRLDISLLAIVELLVEKGVLTVDDFNAKEESIMQKLRETPVSPAQQEAQENAPAGAAVERLTEPMGEHAPSCANCYNTHPAQCTGTCEVAEESVVRRVVEG